MPKHLEGILSDESLVEGWLKIKIRSRRVAVQAGGQNVRDRGPLAAQAWEEEDEVLRGPRLWETGITEADKDEAAHEAAHPAQMATPVEPKEEMASQHQATWLGEA